MADPINSVAVATGSLVVTGTLTSFVAAEGDLFLSGGAVAPIASRQGPAQITLAQPWGGPTLTGAVAWTILSLGPYWRSTITVAKAVADLIGRWDVASPFKFDAYGTLAQRDGYNNQPKGFIYLALDDTRARLYIKLTNTNSASDWSAPVVIGAGGQIDFEDALSAERDQRIAADASIRSDMTTKDGQHDLLLSGLRTDLIAETARATTSENGIASSLNGTTIRLDGRIDATNFALGGRIDGATLALGIRIDNLSTLLGGRIDANTISIGQLSDALTLARNNLTAEIAARSAFDAKLKPLTDAETFLDNGEYDLSGAHDVVMDAGRKLLRAIIGDVQVFGLPVSVPGKAGVRPEGFDLSNAYGVEMDANGALIEGIIGHTKTFGLPVAVPGARGLPPGEFELSGYASMVMSRNRKLVSGTRSADIGVASAAPASAATHEVYAADDGTGAGRTAIYSENRATGKRLRLSSLGGNERNPSIVGSEVRWISDRTFGAAGGAGDAQFGGFVSPLDRADERPILSRRAIFRAGDSTTEQADPALLSSLLPNVPVYNFGKSGRTSGGVVARMGAVQSLYRPITGTIPADTSAVTLTPADSGPCAAYANGAATQHVTFGGVPGTLSWSGTAMTFTRDTAGAAVAVAALTPAISDIVTSDTGVAIPNPLESIVVLQMGTNDGIGLQILTNYNAAVAAIRSRTKRYVVMPLLGSRNDIKGSAGYALTAWINAQLKAKYPNNYLQIGGVDLRQYLVAKGTGADITNDVIQSSLLQPGDPIHPTRVGAASGQGLIAAYLAQFLNSTGWI